MRTFTVPLQFLVVFCSMNMAAQLSGDDLKIFIEDSGWKKTTLPFNRQFVKVELVVISEDGISIFHDASSKPPQVDTHTSLSFCNELLTVTRFKQELKKLNQAEPYEVFLGNNHFTLRKEFSNAYTITFHKYQTNQVFADWLVQSVPALDAGLLIQRLREGKRYCTREFSEFREFTDLKRFTEHRFQLWHDAAVEDFEKQVAKGKTHCHGCDADKNEQDI